MNLNSTIVQAMAELKALGAASMRYGIKDKKDRLLTFLYIVRGIDECAQVSAAIQAVDDSWHNDSLGTAVIDWRDPATDMPDDETRVMIAIDTADTDEPSFGFHREGGWYFDDGSVVACPVYAWAHVPALPAKKGGAS